MAINELPPIGSEPIVRKEVMPEEELGNLLAAVGNHEGKALLIASMSYGNTYFSSDLDRLMEINQGEHPVWRISNNTPFGQCSNSLLPAGLVRVGLQGRDLETYGYEKTAYGEEIGVSLAGHLLSFSERYPDVSLVDLFGSTHSNRKTIAIETPLGTVDYKERAPIVRYDIFYQLLHSKLPISQIDLIKLLGKGKNFIEHHLRRLAQHGIIEYDSIRREGSFAQFKAVEEKLNQPPPDLNKVEFASEIYNILISNPNADITVDYISGILGEKDLPRSEATGRRILYALEYFRKKGYLTKGKFGNRVYSEININEKQRAMLLDLIEILRKIRERDAEFLKDGRSKAYQIAGDPRRFVSLLLKAKEASANANHVDHEDMEKQIISLIYQNPGITNSELQLSLRKSGKDISTGRVAQLTRALRADGRIKTLSRVPVNHYVVNDPTVNLKS